MNANSQHLAVFCIHEEKPQKSYLIFDHDECKFEADFCQDCANFWNLGENK